MKIGNVQVTTNEEILVLPRPQEDIVIKAVAVDMELFEKMVPEPEAPGIRTKEGFKKDTTDKTYLQLVEDRDAKRLGYLVVHSLVPSEVEWDKITLDDPKSWSTWSEELLAGGLSSVEVKLVLSCVMGANALDEEKIAAARASFLRGLLA